MSQVYFLVSNTEVLKYNTLQLQDIIDSVLQELEATTPRSKSSLSVLESMQQQGYRPITPHEYITIIRSQGENAQVPFWIPKENNSTSPSELPTDKSSLNDNYIESMLWMLISWGTVMICCCADIRTLSQHRSRLPVLQQI